MTGFKNTPSVSEMGWKPEVGKECIWYYETREIRVIPRMQCGEYVWVKESLSTDDCKGFVVRERCLRPALSEPPVKMHDVVLVEWGDADPVYGQVTNIHRDTKQFEIGSGSYRYCIKNWDEVVITRLVPDTLYARMKKRLEKERGEYSQRWVHDMFDYLLDDLETYAKETSGPHSEPTKAPSSPAKPRT